MAKKTIRTTAHIVGEAKTAFESLIAEHDSYTNNGNKAAAGRARKATNILTALMKEYRAVSISETK